MIFAKSWLSSNYAHKKFFFWGVAGGREREEERINVINKLMEVQKSSIVFSFSGKGVAMHVWIDVIQLGSPVSCC